jgi:hypothetical protein
LIHNNLTATTTGHTKPLTTLLELEPEERLFVTTGISSRNNQVHHFRPWGLLNIMQQLGAVAICSRPHIKQAVTSGKVLSIFHKTDTTKTIPKGNNSVE